MKIYEMFKERFRTVSVRNRNGKQSEKSKSNKIHNCHNKILIYRHSTDYIRIRSG